MDVNSVFSRLSIPATLALILVLYLLGTLELLLLWNFLGVPAGITNPIGFPMAMVVNLAVFSVGALGKVVLWWITKNISR